MIIRILAAVVLVALGCSCTDKAARQKDQAHRWHEQMVTALKFREVYDTDELATRLIHEADSRLAMADVLASGSFMAPKSHYMRLAPNRLKPSSVGDDIVIRVGKLRMMGADGSRVVDYVFPESRPKGGWISMTGEQWGGERSTFTYTGGEWDSGYYPAYGYYVEPVVLVLAMNGVSDGPQLLAAARPDYVPPTYLLPLTWREDVKVTLADWTELSTEGERESYLGSVAVQVGSRPLARLMAWQILVEGDAQAALGRLTEDDVGRDPVFTGALTYRVLRYGSEAEQAAYVKCIERILEKPDGQISVEGLVLGAVEAYTKLRFINSERKWALTLEMRALHEGVPVGDIYAKRSALEREWFALDRKELKPSSLNRLLVVLTRRVSPDDTGLKYILERIVSRGGPGAMYPDRADRNP